ncbi:MAG: hypothetical protein AMJ62_05760 [Myxococcales bacterium SG8_38]|nr:MAG: hypothetical protein AMJ62_05760 [Myxococcales bacterium SG8_38]
MRAGTKSPYHEAQDVPAACAKTWYAEAKAMSKGGESHPSRSEMTIEKRTSACVVTAPTTTALRRRYRPKIANDVRGPSGPTQSGTVITNACSRAVAPSRTASARK